MDSSTKKMRKDASEIEELQTLRRHILNCKDLQPASNAVKVALVALDKEKERIERDEKLRKKFVSTASVTAGRNNGYGYSFCDASHVIVDRNMVHSGGNGAAEQAHTSGHKHDDIALEEWQDVDCGGADSPSSRVDAMETGAAESDDASLAKGLADTSIAELAASGVKVSSPLGLIPLILHSALRSGVLGFKCTGIPNADAKESRGFAPPIRELPKSVFVPSGWDSHSTTIVRDDTGQISSLGSVSLRYRKDGVGAAIMTVTLLPRNDDEEANNFTGLSGDKFPWEFMLVQDVEKLLVRIQLGETEEKSLSFPLGRHVNVASLIAALASARGGRRTSHNVPVPPTLHYKAVANLMAHFSNAFDLGNVLDERNSETLSDNTIKGIPPHTKEVSPMYGVKSESNVERTSSVRPFPVLPVGAVPGNHPDIHDFNRDGSLGGDFRGDLAPGGVGDPSFSGSNPGLHGGSLMGPNHPIFMGNVDDDCEEHTPSFYSGNGSIPRIGGLGMQPRFDPYGPPNGPTDPNFVDPARSGRGRGRGRAPLSGGDPNNDHLRPPSNLSNNMFL